MDGRERLLLGLAAAFATVTLVVAVRLLIRLVRSRRLLRASGVPTSHKAVFWASVAYLVWPVDLLPDPVYLDDIGFLLLALRSLDAAARRHGVPPARDGGTRSRRGKSG
ncbi:YkvA family protein [Streptomyces sp. NRRL F-5123]|uniref:YkvA family protein n=1 Tax=Streptomyces sp. NRRL F-5123 TaxID=1463856 RepID=UPI0004E25B6C|nr:YkvA family protein [Streptomyces sp. NRRL F-5123]